MKQLTMIVFFLYSLVAYAENYRITKPDAWEAKKIEDAMISLYGTKMTQEDNRVKVILPRLVENPGSIPLTIHTDIPAKSIAVFTNGNPRALVTVFSVNDNPTPSYSIRIKMRQTGYVVIVVEGKDNKLYSYSQGVDRTLCAGGNYGGVTFVKNSSDGAGAWERL